MAAFQFALALLNALPILRDWFHDFAVFYAVQEAAAGKTEFKAAIQLALTKYDQRPLESADIAGKPSGDDGIEIRDRTN